MERYLIMLKELIEINNKAIVAVMLGVSSTNTLDTWIQRKQIPSKYLDIIEKEHKQ